MLHVLSLIVGIVLGAAAVLVVDAKEATGRAFIAGQGAGAVEVMKSVCPALTDKFVVPNKKTP